MEPALRARRWRIGPDQLGDDRYDPDFCLSAEVDLRCDVVPPYEWSGGSAVLVAHDGIPGTDHLCHLRARTHRHFRRGPASVSAGLAIAERLAIEYAGKIDYARRTDGLVHPGGRRDRVVNI